MRHREFIWASANRTKIIRQVKKAMQMASNEQDKETPVNLLEQALKKLQHKDMDISAIATLDYAKARQLASDIQKEASKLEGEIYQANKKKENMTKPS